MTQTQTQQIHTMLRCGPVTALTALQEAGVMRLAARIAELRQAGVDIETRTVKLANGKRIAQYRLRSPQRELPW